MNLSNIFVGYFNQNRNFMANWTTHNDVVINTFIKKFLMGFYDISKAIIMIYKRDILDSDYMTKNNVVSKCTVDNT